MNEASLSLEGKQTTACVAHDKTGFSSENFRKLVPAPPRVVGSFPVFKEFSDEARALRTETVLRHHAARHVTAGNSVELSGPSFPKRRTPAAPSRVGRRFASAAAAHSADLAAPQVAGTGASPAGTEVLLRPRPTLEAPGQNLLLHFSGFSCVLEPARGARGLATGRPSLFCRCSSLSMPLIITSVNIPFAMRGDIFPGWGEPTWCLWGPSLCLRHRDEAGSNSR